MKPTLPIALALVFAAVPVAAQDFQLTPEEVRTTISNKKLFGRGSNGALVDVAFREDGSATVSAGSLNDSGTWRITETGYCATWKVIRQGKEGCFTLVRRGGTLYVLNADGSVNTQILRIVD